MLEHFLLRAQNNNSWLSQSKETIGNPSRSSSASDQFLLRQAFADDEVSTRLLQILLFLLLSTASLMFIPCAVHVSLLFLILSTNVTCCPSSFLVTSFRIRSLLDLPSILRSQLISATRILLSS